jgi:hypothetical protein
MKQIITVLILVFISSISLAANITVETPQPEGLFDMKWGQGSQKCKGLGLCVDGPRQREYNKSITIWKDQRNIKQFYIGDIPLDWGIFTYFTYDRLYMIEARFFSYRWAVSRTDSTKYHRNGKWVTSNTHPKSEEDFILEALISKYGQPERSFYDTEYGKNQQLYTWNIDQVKIQLLQLDTTCYTGKRCSPYVSQQCEARWTLRYTYLPLYNEVLNPTQKPSTDLQKRKDDL